MLFSSKKTEGDDNPGAWCESTISTTDGEVSYETTLGEQELLPQPVDCCVKQHNNKSSRLVAKGLTEEGKDATTKGECEAELCGIKSGETSSFAVSQSTNEASDWDNNASMTQADSKS